MNVWRCWRTTRWVVAIYLFLLGYAALESVRKGPIEIFRPFSIEASTWMQLSMISRFTAAAAWALGGVCIGRELADGSGAFLLTRPRPRSYFVWTESGLVFAELCVIASMTMGLYLAALHFHLYTFVTSGPLSVPTAPLVAAPATQMAAIAAPLILLSAVLYIALVYSVTYFTTVLLRRNSMGLIAAAGVFALYELLYEKASPVMSLPNWMLDPFTQTLRFQLAPHLLTSILMRIGIILLITYASQMVLERIEIRA